MKKHTARKIPDRIKHGYPETLRRLVVAVRDVQARRQMTAPEPPEMQDAWDRLRLAVLESERLLVNPLTKRRR